MLQQWEEQQLLRRAARGKHQHLLRVPALVHHLRVALQVGEGREVLQEASLVAEGLLFLVVVHNVWLEKGTPEGAEASSLPDDQEMGAQRGLNLPVAVFENSRDACRRLDPIRAIQGNLDTPAIYLLSFRILTVLIEYRLRILSQVMLFETFAELYRLGHAAVAFFKIRQLQ